MSKALLALEDGSIFYGKKLGAKGITTGEVVFNTSMTGYQEILTDPSYAEQIVTLTYPHIGNTGVNSLDIESNKVSVKGLIIRDYLNVVSSWRSEEDLDSYLNRNNIVAIYDIDTRKLANKLRISYLNGCIDNENLNAKKAILNAKNYQGLEGRDLTQEYSCKQISEWTQGLWQDDKNQYLDIKSDPKSKHIVVYDYGVKFSILRWIKNTKAKVTVVPGTTSVEDILKLKPDGIILSNGPGDPAATKYAILNIQKLIETNIPLFGICLGHQLLALAVGAKTFKMKLGHHGGNHPVQNILNKKMMITSQNHGFAVDENTLPKNVIATHKSLFDGTLQGIKWTDKKIFGFQGHPEAGPGPNDMQHLFNEFYSSL